MAKSGVTIKTDFVDDVMKQIRALTKTEALIGVPDENAGRDPVEGQEKTPISNAEIGYVMEFGMPEKNVPARPFLVPGVEDAKTRVGDILKAGAIKALRGDKDAASQSLEKAGLVASVAVKKKITDGPFVPLSPKTVAERYRQRNGTTRRKGENNYLGLVASGIDPAVAQAQSGIRPLINTAQLRNSITSVIRPKGK